MRAVPARLEKVWREGDYTGDKRPRARVTVQHPQMKLRTWGMKSTFTFLKPAASGAQDAAFAPLVDPRRPSPVTNTYADFLFSATDRPLELPNVASIEWERTTDTDAATCTVTLLNTKPREVDDRQREPGLDYQGYYTHDRGTTDFSYATGARRNEYNGLLLPDNLIRTYEGYGWDLDKIPEDDPHLVQTGLWIIDTVAMTSDGEGIPTITLQCRDMMRLLLDQIAFPTVVPPDFYPLSFASFKERFKIGEEDVKVGQKESGVLDWGKANAVPITVAGTSNDAWPNSGQSSILRNHPGRHAIDGDPSTYWLSIGNSKPSARFSFEYITFNTKGATVSGVRFKTRGKGYNAYLSFKVDGRWRGDKKIEYNNEGVGRNQADIAYLTSCQVVNEDEHFLAVKAAKNVEQVRITFGNLQKMENGYVGGPYRVGVRDAVVVAGPPDYEGVYEKRDILSELRPGPAGSNPGRAKEYTEIVKLACAWAGFYWPEGGRSMNTEPLDDGRGRGSGGGRAKLVSPKRFDDDVLGAPVHGQVWGDFQDSGTMAVAPLLTDNFDKKPLMDIVNTVKDILGFVFYCDESGAVQWRLPNIYEVGNLYTGLNPRPGRTRKMYSIDEKVTLMSLTSTLDSKNVREVVFVANGTAQIGAVAAGWNPNYVGLRRTAGWTDQRFGSEGGDEDAKRLREQAREQTKQMADMITIRQLFTYRTDQVTIPGFPGIQIDDQVRLIERVTAEGYIHYVKGITSSHDLRSGEWTYDLQTHWLGDRVGGKWVMDRTKLAPVTRDYINRVQRNPPVEQSRFPNG